MALYGGSQSARTGPYWRRQLGTTLPGERTGAELAAINALRAKMGLPPLGGPALRGAAPAAPQVPPAYGPPPPPPGVGPMPGEPGAAPPGVVGSPAQLGQLQLPQLLALKAMLARSQGQPRPAPPQRGILPQLHQVVPVRSHVRIAPPRPALGAANLPQHLRPVSPAY